MRDIDKRLVLTLAVLILLTLAIGCLQNSEEMTEPNEDIQEITLPCLISC